MYFRAHIIPDWSRESDLGIAAFNFESENRALGERTTTMRTRTKKDATIAGNSVTGYFLVISIC